MALKSLRQRLFLMVLLPVGLLLFLIGVFGFIYMRGSLFEEWQDASIVKLQRAAHQVDMRLGRINDWIQMFHKTADTLGGPLVQTWIVQQLRDMKGVTHAELKWKDSNGSQATGMTMRRGGSGMGGGRMMRFHRAKIAKVTPPSYNAQTGQETVRIISQLKDESEAVVGTLEISVSFNYLLEGIKAFAWWQTDQACLIDDHGDIWPTPKPL